MVKGHQQGRFFISLNERILSVLVFSLFFAWKLALVFEGQILYSLADYFKIDPTFIVIGGVGGSFIGLFSAGFLIKSIEGAKRYMLASIIICLIGSLAFFFKFYGLWLVSIIVISFLAGIFVASWGFYLHKSSLKSERVKTVADCLILSNILMIILNMVAIHISPYLGLALSIFTLVLAFVFTLALPIETSVLKEKKHEPKIGKPLAFLFLFIFIITINSGLMYQVLNPAFAHLSWLTSWYWALPYIIALFLLRNLPRKINRTYILYLAIGMIGFSFIAFISFSNSVGAYLLVDTLMLGACGVYDLFWWSILGELMDYHKNPSKVLGIGLAANVLGVLAGDLIGRAIGSHVNSSLIALAIVCLTLILLPPLHKYLSLLLKNHVFLDKIPEKELVQIDKADKFKNLSERESQVASLLCQGRTYKAIGKELNISENTVKYYVKGIYSKFGIKTRAELINTLLNRKNNENT